MPDAAAKKDENGLWSTVQPLRILSGVIKSYFVII